MKDIRLLRVDEIECRIQTVTDKGCSLLLYKDARVDMRILDEIYTVNGWQRTHEVINGNLFCNIDIWDDVKKAWIRKQDVGVESNTEKEKGQASDAFKRAGFNIGIGRELYTAPFIWVNLYASDFGTNKKIKTRFNVHDISYNDNREIISVTIMDDKGKLRYKLENGKQQYLNTISVNNDSDIELASIEIKEAKTLVDLTSIYNRWKGLQKDTRFTSSLTTRRNEIERK